MQRVKSPIDSFRRVTARRLRGQETEAEARLWKALQRIPVTGTHFRRQVPIGPYVADFACLAAKLIIEVDGSQHGRDAIISRDAARTRSLETQGNRVLRFWNRDIHTNLRGVLDSIYAALHGGLNTEPQPMLHRRRRDNATPPRHAARVDPPPPGEGDERMAQAVGHAKSPAESTNA
jgi:very-short-patch-repair endonuclease